MIVYLDQNKWIELSRIFHGKEKDEASLNLLSDAEDALGKGVVFPLSAVHYMEFSRISNDGRRSRLGSTMWHFSKGRTIAPYRKILIYEIEVALQSFFPGLVPRSIDLIGQGVAHAFGEKFDDGSDGFWPFYEESILTGSHILNIPPIKGFVEKPKENFFNHLLTLHDRLRLIPKSQWENFLLAISSGDILEPTYEVMKYHGLLGREGEVFGSRDAITTFLMRIPTRVMDIHLHRQVMKNPEYKPKLSDLEDWAGVGVASCYCDVVVCEKHLADMLQRDSYLPRARVEKQLAHIFQDGSLHAP